MYAMIPGGGVTFRYTGQAEVEGDDVDILSVYVFTNGVKGPFATLPEEQYAKEFYAIVREQVRQSFWALALQAAKEAGYTNPQDINTAAEMWQRTGKACLVLERGLSTEE